MDIYANFLQQTILTSELGQADLAFSVQSGFISSSV